MPKNNIWSRNAIEIKGMLIFLLNVAYALSWGTSILLSIDLITRLNSVMQHENLNYSYVWDHYFQTSHGNNKVAFIVLAIFVIVWFQIRLYKELKSNHYGRK